MRVSGWPSAATHRCSAPSNSWTTPKSWRKKLVASLPAETTPTKLALEPALRPLPRSLRLSGRARHCHPSPVRSMCKRLLLLTLFLPLALPVAAQEGSITDYQERLPEETIFYLTWHGLEGLKELRATNPLLRFLDSPEMRANWEALKDFYRRQEEARAKQKSKAESGKPERTKTEMDLHELAPLLSNPGLIAVLAPPATDEAAAERPEPGVVYLYDSTGKEELLATLEARAGAKDKTTTEYDFEGTTVVETTDA